MEFGATHVFASMRRRFRGSGILGTHGRQGDYMTPGVLYGRHTLPSSEPALRARAERSRGPQIRDRPPITQTESSVKSCSTRDVEQGDQGTDFGSLDLQPTSRACSGCIAKGHKPKLDELITTTYLLRRDQRGLPRASCAWARTSPGSGPAWLCTRPPHRGYHNGNGKCTVLTQCSVPASSVDVPRSTNLAAIASGSPHRPRGSARHRQLDAASSGRLLSWSFEFVEGNAELTPARAWPLIRHVFSATATLTDVFVPGPLHRRCAMARCLHRGAHRVPRGDLERPHPVMSERENHRPRLRRLEAAPGSAWWRDEPVRAVGTARISGAVYYRMCRSAWATSPQRTRRSSSGVRSHWAPPTRPNARRSTRSGSSSNWCGRPGSIPTSGWARRSVVPSTWCTLPPRWPSSVTSRVGAEGLPRCRAGGALRPDPVREEPRRAPRRIDHRVVGGDFSGGRGPRRGGSAFPRDRLRLSPVDRWKIDSHNSVMIASGVRVVSSRTRIRPD